MRTPADWKKMIVAHRHALRRNAGNTEPTAAIWNDFHLDMINLAKRKLNETIPTETTTNETESRKAEGEAGQHGEHEASDSRGSESVGIEERHTLLTDFI